MLRFIHTSDLHLGSPFKGLDRISPQISTELRNATFRTFDAIIKLAIRERVDAVLIAGDIFDAADRSLKAQIAFHRGLEELDAAGIASFICHGNHDPLDGWEAKLAFPPSCHRFGPEVEEVRIAAHPETVVVGVSYPTRDIYENLAARFDRPQKAKFAIGMLHCNVNNDPRHLAYAPCTLDTLNARGIDYWALGHIHDRKVLRDHSPAVVYPGTPQGRNPREVGARGVFLIKVDDDLNIELEFKPTDVVRWDSIDLPLDTVTTEDELLKRVRAAARQHLGSCDGRNLVYSLNLKGTTPLHDTLQRPGFVVDMIHQINDELSSTKPWAWCGRFEADTRLAFDRAQRLKGKDFVAVLLQEVDGLKNDKDQRNDLALRLRDLYYHDRLRKFLAERTPSDSAFLSIIERAEELCVRLLASTDE